jgi:hypothetical protein
MHQVVTFFTNYYLTLRLRWKILKLSSNVPGDIFHKLLPNIAVKMKDTFPQSDRPTVGLDSVPGGILRVNIATIVLYRARRSQLIFNPYSWVPFYSHLIPHPARDISLPATTKTICVCLGKSTAGGSRRRAHLGRSGDVSCEQEGADIHFRWIMHLFEKQSQDSNHTPWNFPR